MKFPFLPSWFGLAGVLSKKHTHPHTHTSHIPLFRWWCIDKAFSPRSCKDLRTTFTQCSANLPLSKRYQKGRTALPIKQTWLEESNLHHCLGCLWAPKSSQRFSFLELIQSSSSPSRKLSLGNGLRSCLFYLRSLIMGKRTHCWVLTMRMDHEPSRTLMDRWGSLLQLHHCDEPSHVDHIVGYIGLNGDPFIGNASTLSYRSQL